MPDSTAPTPVVINEETALPLKVVYTLIGAIIVFTVWLTTNYVKGNSNEEEISKVKTSVSKDFTEVRAAIVDLDKDRLKKRDEFTVMVNGFDNRLTRVETKIDLLLKMRGVGP